MLNILKGIKILNELLLEILLVNLRKDGIINLI